VGCMNVQYAMLDGVVYVIEANPRASRTVPYVSKATGVPWARIACQVLGGHTLEELGVPDEPMLEGHFCKEVVLPFQKFIEEPPTLGPEMRSTGEVMGMDTDFGMAYAKAQIAGGNALPTAGTAFLSVNDRDKRNLVPIARELQELGFALIATRGTAAALQAAGLTVQPIFKVHEGRPHCVDRIINGEIALVVETPLTGISYGDEHVLRAAAVAHGVPMMTTLSAARAATKAIAALQRGQMEVQSLQEHWHQQTKSPRAGAS
jgi:carbamoyl-phosphate synthase large subunit